MLQAEKKRKYEEQIREVEHGTFSHLVFSCTGGMGPLATVVYKRIAALLSEKNGQHYSKTLYWLRCKLSFLYFVQPLLDQDLLTTVLVFKSLQL